MIEDRGFGELTARQWHDIARLRVEVFVVEQECAYPDFDGRDTEASTRHYWIAGRDVGEPELEIACYARALADSGGGSRIGRIVTHPQARGNGLAGAIIKHFLATITGPWSLDAQARLEGWYASFGFRASGPQFDDWGMPHIPMRLNPRTDPQSPVAGPASKPESRRR